MIDRKRFFDNRLWILPDFETLDKAIIFHFQVQCKHVKEAFRLLNKSIIRVEQPDIHLEEEEETEQQDVEMEVDESKRSMFTRRVIFFLSDKYKKLPCIIWEDLICIYSMKVSCLYKNVYKAKNYYLCGTYR